MANPQLENGFLQIANEIEEQLCKCPLSDYEHRCLRFLIRKTYGYKKKEDWISLSQFSEATDIAKPHVCRTMKKLVAKKIVTQTGNSYYVRYSFQKDYDQWLPLLNKARLRKEMSLPEQAIPSTQIGNEPLPKQVDTKYNKETVTKENQPDKLAHFSKEFLEKDIKAQALNFNIHKLYNKVKKEGLCAELPESVLIAVLDEVLMRHEHIANPWPYFVRVLKDKSAQHFSALNQLEHEAIKKNAGVDGIKSILNQMGLKNYA